MPVSQPDVVDYVGVDPSTGVVCLSMFEDRDWTDVSTQLQDFERKINSYISFVFGGQLHEHAEFRDRPVRFELCCQYAPPKEVAHVLRAAREHLESQDIALVLLVGSERFAVLI
jgi:hypothetical protein